MSATSSPSPLVREAQELATSLLRDVPGRLAHVRGAAVIAGMAAGALGVDEPDTVVAAAWLHDIGYSPAIVRTGFHPLDGALHLAGEGWPETTVLLVAHHSHAAVLAPYYGVWRHYALFDHAHGDADDVITFSDLRAGFDGMGADPLDRIEDMRRRHIDRTLVPHEIGEARLRMLLLAAARVNAAVNRATHAPDLNRPSAHAS